MSEELEALIDELVKSWAKYKSATDENEKEQGWIDATIYLDRAMAQYLKDWSDTDIVDQTETYEYITNEMPGTDWMHATETMYRMAKILGVPYDNNTWTLCDIVEKKVNKLVMKNEIIEEAKGAEK